MKKILTSLLLSLTLYLGACSSPTLITFKPVPTDSIHAAHKTTDARIDSAKAHADKVKAQLAIAQKLAPEVPDLHKALDLAAGEVDALTADLLAAKSSNVDAEAKLKSADGQIKAMTDKANVMAGNYNKLEKQYADLRKRYHKIKAGACGLFALLALAVLWKFHKALAMLPPPIDAYAMLAYVVIPIGAFGIAWALLTHFGM